MTPRTVEVTIVMKARLRERTREIPIGKGETRDGGARARMCLYQKSDHSSIGNWGPPSGPFWNDRMPSTMNGP